MTLGDRYAPDKNGFCAKTRNRQEETRNMMFLPRSLGEGQTTII